MQRGSGQERVQVAALESVLAIQEEQLMQQPLHAGTPDDAALGDADSTHDPRAAAIVALLPRWRAEALQQHELRLEAEARLSDAAKQHSDALAALQQKLRSSEAANEVR